MNWVVEWTPRALRDLRRLERNMASRVLEAVERYAESRSGDVRQLRARNRTRRLRVGPIRVLFVLDYEDHKMRIDRVLPRDVAYRR